MVFLQIFNKNCLLFLAMGWYHEMEILTFSWDDDLEDANSQNFKNKKTMAERAVRENEFN